MTTDSHADLQENDTITTKTWFEFRFTKYYYSETREMFVPIEFDYYKPFSYLISKYESGVNEGVHYNNTVEKYGK